MSDAARRGALSLRKVPGLGALGQGTVAPQAAADAWSDWRDELGLVLDVSRFEALLFEALAWADKVTLCVSAPQSQQGDVVWWRELLAHGGKLESVFVRRAEQADAWLLQRLHETGSLRLTEGGGKQVASNLLLFARGGELRALFAHMPLERALAGAAFGALLGFRGSPASEFARACRAQLESCAQLSHIPLGAEIDALLRATQRPEARVVFAAPPEPRVVSEPAELAECVGRLAAAITVSAARASSVPDTGSDFAGFDAVLDGACSAAVRRVAGGYQLSLERTLGAPALTLTLLAGEAWAAGNALVLRASDGHLLLVWRGGLLGQTPSRSALLWSQARLRSFLLEAESHALEERVAVVLHTGDPAAPQLARFAQEIQRLGELFRVEPPPALGHAVVEFAALSPKQQAALLWKALLGLGPLDLELAIATAARALRDQGYVRFQRLARESELYGRIAELLANAAERGIFFDCPELGRLRAIQPDVGAYLEDDWLECWMRALPENCQSSRRRALRLTFEHARRHWGLAEPSLAAGGDVHAALESSLGAALRRGLLLRVGAAALKRPSAWVEGESAAASKVRLEPGAQGLVAEWQQALAGLNPVYEFMLSRRTGRRGACEPLADIAERLGLGLERARQVEGEAWLALEQGSRFAATLRARLERALAGERFVSLRLLLREDAWWRGIEQELELVQPLFDGLLGGELHCMVVGGGARSWRNVLFARFSQADVDVALERVFIEAAAIATPASRGAYQALLDAAAAVLDPGLAEYLGDALAAHLELAPDDPSSVLRFASKPAPLAEAPPLDAHRSEAQLRLVDVIRTVFRIEKSPLPLAVLAERVRRRAEIDDGTLRGLVSAPPFVELAGDRYGLLARDVPGGHAAIVRVLNGVAGALEAEPGQYQGKRALALYEELGQPGSFELFSSLLWNDPVLSVSAAHDVCLRSWRSALLPVLGELLLPGIPSAAREHFERLTRTPGDNLRQALESVRREQSRLERTTGGDALAASLARHTFELYERLLVHVEQGSDTDQCLALAAVAYLMALAPSDDGEPNAAALEVEALREVRLVLKAVLAHCQLDWL